MLSFLEGWEALAVANAKLLRLKRTERRAGVPSIRKDTPIRPRPLDIDDILYRYYSKLESKSNGCIEWIGSKMKWNGALPYGRWTIKGKHTVAHRMAWILENGLIPDGMDVCHHCDNPSCCNPQHLFLGSPRTNMIDMVIKRRRVYKLTPQNVEEIRKANGSQESIAKAFGVSQASIHRIKTNKAWNFV